MEIDEITEALETAEKFRKQYEAQAAEQTQSDKLAKDEFWQCVDIARAGWDQVNAACAMFGSEPREPNREELEAAARIAIKAKRAQGLPIAPLEVVPNWDIVGDPRGWWATRTSAIPDSVDLGEHFARLRQQTKIAYGAWDIDPVLMCSPSFRRLWRGLSARLRAVDKSSESREFIDLCDAGFRGLQAMRAEIEIRNRFGENNDLLSSEEIID